MEITNIKVSQIQPPTFYYKTITNTDQQKLINSIRQFGLLRNIVVRHFSKDIYEVIEGRNILAACITLGMTEIPCVSKGGMSIEDAKQINITLNQMHSFEDHASLAYDIAALAENSSVNELCKTLPYSQEQIKRFQQIAKFSWEDFKKQYAKEQVDMFATIEEEPVIEEVKEKAENEVVNNISEISESSTLKSTEENVNNTQIEEKLNKIIGDYKSPTIHDVIPTMPVIQECSKKAQEADVMIGIEKEPISKEPIVITKNEYSPVEDESSAIDTNAVYGECTHGNNMAVCEECMKEIVKEEQSIVEEVKETKQEEIFPPDSTKDTGRQAIDLFS